MEEKKLGPDSYTVNAIVGALNDAGKIDEAEELLSKMSEKCKLLGPKQTDDEQKVVSREPSNGPDSSSVAYSEQIDELCAEGRYKDAMNIFSEQTQKGITLNKSSYISLMNGLIKRRKSILKEFP
ncbi:hypothetical protein C2S51_033102 [Perilla frutescens var. frutescens]|nr:hypothetical protein C2S51_033102 [Perilla frutescens var. frutescens]